eukprot:Platyproteum_vivax@DN4644_c0_g1_i1.p1
MLKRNNLINMSHLKRRCTCACNNLFVKPAFCFYDNFAARAVCSISVPRMGSRRRNLADVSMTGTTNYTVTNEGILFPEMRVIFKDNTQKLLTRTAALNLAHTQKEDLILIKDDVTPVLCKLMKYEEYLDEVAQRAADIKQKKIDDLEKQYSFDPGLKVKRILMSSACDTADFNRKMDSIRYFIKKGHRLEVQFHRSSGHNAATLADRIARVVSELKDISKPHNLPFNKNQIQELKVLVKFWPCSPEQAAAYSFPGVSKSAPNTDIPLPLLPGQRLPKRAMNAFGKYNRKDAHPNMPAAD